MICMIHDYERNLAKTPGGVGELRYDIHTDLRRGLGGSMAI